MCDSIVHVSPLEVKIMTRPTISDELLKKAGYVELDADSVPGAVDRLFEKRFKDEHGVKYSLLVKYWHCSQNGVQLQFWDFSMQVETEKGALNFETVQWFNQNGTYSGRTIQEAEAYFEWLWIRHGKLYYEEKAVE